MLSFAKKGIAMSYENEWDIDIQEQLDGNHDSRQVMILFIHSFIHSFRSSLSFSLDQSYAFNDDDYDYALELRANSEYRKVAEARVSMNVSILKIYQNYRTIN